MQIYLTWRTLCMNCGFPPLPEQRYIQSMAKDDKKTLDILNQSKLKAQRVISYSVCSSSFSGIHQFEMNCEYISCDFYLISYTSSCPVLMNIC